MDEKHLRDEHEWRLVLECSRTKYYFEARTHGIVQIELANWERSLDRVRNARLMMINRFINIYY